MELNQLISPVLEFKQSKKLVISGKIWEHGKDNDVIVYEDRDHHQMSR